jgi:CRISPR-associated endonuclease/helicase Cas3
MPKLFQFGRVFFPGEAKAIPNEIRFQPLGNHVGNVMQLVNAWDFGEFSESEESLTRVLEAAKIHDMGKPKQFAINAMLGKRDEFKHYTYSFKGHRFDAKSRDLWSQTLAVGHHDFSVGDITRDTHKLKKETQYAGLLTQDPLAYARELYILEMCDQIEAELACRLLGDDQQAKSRAFMEFTITKDRHDSSIYRIDPFPFSHSSITLTFRYWSCRPVDIDKFQKLQHCLDKNNQADLGRTLDKLVKEWWRGLPELPAEEKPITITLKSDDSHIRAVDWTAVGFYQELAGFEPTPMQTQLFDAIYDPVQVQKSSGAAKFPAIFLKGPTGSGKTESILFPALASGYRLILPLPARSLLDDQKQRIENYLQKFSQLSPDRELSLVVDTGSQMYRIVYKNGEVLAVHNPRRHLFKGDVILTTLDKFLYRYFAFGDKQKSFIFPYRINQDKTLICFDESHSYENIAFTNFQSLVKSLYEAGRSLVLMTATMPPQLEKHFDYLESVDFTKDLAQHPKRILIYDPIDIENQTDSTELAGYIAKRALKEWGAKPNRRILVVVETVRDAVDIYIELRERLKVHLSDSDQFLFLYHGRIADQVRPELYNRIQHRDQKCQPYILVTTSAIEVGCDLNAEILISQICPPENLIQRAGRCNRRGNVPDAKVIVIGNHIPDFANTLDGEGLESYKRTLSELTAFDASIIAQCIACSEHVDDYRVVELFSMLHDYVYGADLTCEPTHKRGLIPTRSWEPSAELRYIFDNEKFHSISVPISGFYRKDGTRYSFIFAFERQYNQESTMWVDVPLRWGSAYNKDIIIQIQPGLGDLVFDASLPEYPYDPDLGFVELPTIFSAKWVDRSEVKLKYEVNNQPQGKYVAILSYIKSLDS